MKRERKSDACYFLWHSTHTHTAQVKNQSNRQPNQPKAPQKESKEGGTKIKQEWQKWRKGATTQTKGPRTKKEATTKPERKERERKRARERDKDCFVLFLSSLLLLFLLGSRCVCGDTGEASFFLVEIEQNRNKWRITLPFFTILSQNYIRVRSRICLLFLKIINPKWQRKKICKLLHLKSCFITCNPITDQGRRTSQILLLMTHDSWFCAPFCPIPIRGFVTKKIPWRVCLASFGVCVCCNMGSWK